MHKKYIPILALLLTACFLAFSGCEINISTNGSNNPLVGGSPSSSTSHLGTQTKTSGCVAHGGLPDSACTSGAVFTNATPQQFCVYGYTRKVRNVPSSEKDQVYAEYGIQYHSPGQYEVDHLIPLELGGSNDIANLWPEAASPKPGFHEKDKVENYLHDQVCSGGHAATRCPNPDRHKLAYRLSTDAYTISVSLGIVHNECESFSSTDRSKGVIK